ncbi:hypothetical protein LINGRAHAP2_LOCUS33232 [Linum grandiflorum]
MSAPCHCHPPSAVIMKNTFAVPTFHIYDKIHDPIFMAEIYKLLDWDRNRGMLTPVPRFAWAISSAISWILMFMFPHEELFLYVPKSLNSGKSCFIFYAILVTAALSLTYAAYKFGEGVKAGTYRLGRLVKIMDYLAFVLITAIVADGDDGQRSVMPILGLVGFIWEFCCLMKLGWNFVDYTLFEMVFLDTLWISQITAFKPLTLLRTVTVLCAILLWSATLKRWLSCSKVRCWRCWW